MDIDFIIERDGIEVPVIVDFTYHKATKGARGSYGEPLEPDEPEDFEFEKATVVETGEEIELTNQEIEKAVQ